MVIYVIVLGGFGKERMIISKDPWDTDTHDPAELMSGLTNCFWMMTMSVVREQESNRDSMTVLFFQQLY